jgi:aminoglycoside 6-adenylyltransferase
MHPIYDETVGKLRRWSQRERDIRCALLLGSQVREEGEGDEWSDLDVLLLVDDPSVFMQTDTWLAVFGEIICVTVEETLLDWVQLTWYVKRALFADNRALDFSILPYHRVDDVLSINAEVHAQGYQVIYDDCANGIAPKIETTLAAVEEKAPEIPSEGEVSQTIHDLLFHLAWACKKVKRGELWVAVRCINKLVSDRLQQLIEYHTISRSEVSSHIRYDGRFLESRIGKEIAEKLPHCFARYDEFDAIRTVLHLLDTTYRLAKEICEVNDYSFNEHPFDMIRKLYDDMFVDGS